MNRPTESRALRSAQTDEEVIDLKRMRAQAIAGHFLHRVDTEHLEPRDGVSVGACRTDVAPTEFKSGVTAFEVVMWCLAAFLSAVALDGAPSFFQWAFK